MWALSSLPAGARPSFRPFHGCADQRRALRPSPEANGLGFATLLPSFGSFQENPKDHLDQEVLLEDDWSREATCRLLRKKVTRSLRGLSFWTSVLRRPGGSISAGFGTLEQVNRFATVPLLSRTNFLRAQSLAWDFSARGRGQTASDQFPLT